MKRIIGILCGLFFFLSSFAQETFQKETYISSRGDTLLYRLLRPEVMKPDEKYPLVLFLHGAGECGNDNEKQLVHGGQMWLNPVNREKYPAFILAPQCPETETFMLRWIFRSAKVSVCLISVYGDCVRIR